MNKVVVFFIALAVSGNALAGKRRPVHLGHYDHRVVNAYLNRSALQVPLDIFREENILHVCSEEDLVITLCFLNTNKEILAEEFLSGNSNSVEIPAEATDIIVYVGDSVFVGMLY